MSDTPMTQPFLATKPPLGVMPHAIWMLSRQEDLERAIREYAEAGFEVNPDWVRELADLDERFPR